MGLTAIQKVKRILEIRYFSSPYDQCNYFTAEKVSGACSHHCAIGPKVGEALVPPVLWLPRPCCGHIGRAAPVSRSMGRSVPMPKWLRHFGLWPLRSLVTSVFLKIRSDQGSRCNTFNAYASRSWNWLHY